MTRVAAGVRKRKDGSFEKRFTVNGKRYSVYGKNSKECTAKEQEIRTQIANGAYIRNTSITLDQYFEEWQKNRNVKHSTADMTRSKYETHIQPALGNRKIQKIEKREVQALQQKLLKDHKPATVNCIIGTVKAILNTAVEDEIIQKNPAVSIKAIPLDEDNKASETIHRALTREEQKAFMGEAEKEWLYDFFCMLLYTGMRIMEISALKWGDIDKVNNTIHVTKTLCYDRDTNKYYEGKPKSKAGKRDIPMNDLIKAALIRQKEKMFMVYGSAGVKQDSRIFLGENGSTIVSGSVIKVINRTIRNLKAKEIEMDPFTPHAFRDTFATRYIESGGNMQTLKTILGHSSLAMTMDLYAHVLPNTKQREMDMIQSGFM